MSELTVPSRFLPRLLTAIVVCLLLFLASAQLFAYWYVPKLLSNKSWLQSKVADSSPIPVTLKDSRAHWQGGWPELILSGVCAKPPQNISADNICADTVKLRFNFMASLFAAEPVIDSILISGVSLDIPIKPSAADFSAINSKQWPLYVTIAEQYLSLLPDSVRTSLKHVTLSNIRINQFKNVQLQLERGRILTRLYGQFSTDNLGEQKIIIQLNNNAIAKKQLNGQAYVKFQHVPVEWFNPLLAHHADLSLSGTANGETWLKLSDSMHWRLQTHFEWQKGRFSAKQQPWSQFSAKLEVERAAKSWAMTASDINLKQNNKTSAKPFAIAGQKEGNHWQFKANSLDLSLQSFIKPLLSEKQAQLLSELQPSGILKQVLIDYQSGIKHAQAELRQFSIAPWRSVPGVKQLNALVASDGQRGFVRFMNQPLTLDATAVLPEPLQLKRLKGTVYWLKSNDTWRIDTSIIELSDANLKGRLSFALIIPKIAADAKIDLLGRFQFLNLQHINNYLPKKHTSEQLKQWLKSAILADKGGVGSAVLRGRLRDYPFEKNQGDFTISADFYHGLLRYNPKWPVAKIDHARLVFHNRGMNGVISKGSTSDIPLSNVTIDLPFIGKHREVLVIKAKAETSLAKGLAFLQQSPLKQIFNLPDNLTAVGSGAVDFVLSLPLGKTEKVMLIDGNASIKASEVQFPEPWLKLTDLAAKLTFTANSIAADAIKFNFNKQPGTLTIAVGLFEPGQAKTQININFPSLTYAGIEQKNVNLFVKPIVSGWQIVARSDSSRAELFYKPKADPQLEIKLGQLTIPTLEGNSHIQAESIINALPPMRINVANLQLASKRLGRVNVNIKPLKSGIELTELQSFVAGAYQLNLGGQWLVNNKANRSEFNGRLLIDDLARSLAAWSLPPVINSKNGKADFSLSMPVVPWKIKPAMLNGTITFNLQNGHITKLSKEAEEKIGLSKLINILNLQTLPRHLVLDFDDLSKGLPFDEFKATLKLKGGVAEVSNCRLTGSVAKIDITGRLNLADESYDLVLTVYPVVTASLPLVATIAGGPVAGVAALVANTVLSKGAFKVSSYTYEITGPWKNPKIREVKVIKHEIKKRKSTN